MVQSSALDLARLAIIFDTTSAPGAIAAMQSVTAQSRQVGAAIDATSRSFQTQNKAALDAARGLNQLNQAHAAAASGYKRGTNDAQAYTRTVMDLKRALDEEAKAAAGVAAGHQQRAAAIGRLMAASRTEYQQGAISVQQYSTRLQQLQVEMNKLAGVQNTLSASNKAGAQNVALMSGAVGGFVGILGFQALSAVTQFAGAIAGLPGDFAHAGDELERLTARITFAFRGSTEAARLARQDMIAMARETGVPLSQVSQSYGDLAIAGRGPGLSRGQIGGLVQGFSTLGAMTGADNASTGRAMWQFQQALALGRLTSQDYRFMATNMPAIDDALAAGMGVDVNTIPGRISRGEIDANRMVDALIRGVEILRQTSGGLPETMERARGRIQTEWELMLSNMEARIQSSDFFQALMGGTSDLLRRSNILGAGTPEQQLELRRADLEIMPADMLGRAGLEAEVARLEALVNDPGRRRTLERQRMGVAREEQEVQRNAVLGRGLQAADSAFSLDLQRSDITTSIGQIERALGVAGAANAPPEDIERLARALTAFRTQLSRLVSVAERRVIEADNAERDLARYGAGAGFDIAQSARSLAEQAAMQGRPIGDDAARGIILRDRFIGSVNSIGAASDELRRRQIVVDAAGGTAQQRRLAALDAGDDEFRSTFGGNLNAEQTAQREELLAADRRNRAARYAQDDVQALRERERADRERLETMRAQIEAGIQLGQQGRISVAQAERERELRREFPDITQELVQAERERVAEAVRVTEQLQMQQREFALLQDTAQTAGAAMGSALSAGIIAGVRSGRDGAEAILASLTQSAERILGNMLDRLILPFEQRMTEMAGGGLERLLGLGAGSGAKDGADKSLSALTDAATQAGGALAESLLPSVVDNAAKVALGATAAAAETNARAAAIGSLITFSKALDLASAAAAGKEGGDIVGAIVGAFTGGGGKGVPKFASGVENFGGGWAVVGEEGEELVKLPRGSNVYSHGRSKSMLGQSNVSVNIIDQRSGGSAPVQTRESTGPDGGRVIEVIVRDAVRSAIRKGEVNSEMRDQFGTAPAIRKA